MSTLEDDCEVNYTELDSFEFSPSSIDNISSYLLVSNVEEIDNSEDNDTDSTKVFSKKRKRNSEELIRQKVIKENFKALRDSLPNGEDLSSRYKTLSEKIKNLNSLIRKNHRLYSKN